jgi:hypothetical protein
MKIKIDVKQLREDINLIIWENSINIGYMQLINNIVGGIEYVEVNFN